MGRHLWLTKLTTLAIVRGESLRRELGSRDWRAGEGRRLWILLCAQVGLREIIISIVLLLLLHLGVVQFSLV